MTKAKKKRGANRDRSDSDSETETDSDFNSDSDCDSDPDSDHENERGRTVLATVRKAIQNGDSIPLEWNTSKVPCGEHRTTFGTYVGVIARERVNIAYEGWTQVPTELVNEVYTDIAKAFIILPDRRRWVVSRASERWRAFKTRLVKKYLYKRSGKIRKKAPSKYPFILQSDWKKFTSYCTSDKFKEKSEKNRARANLKTSKYRGGRLGYQHFDKEIVKDFEEQGIHIEKAPRHLTWLKAHKKKADESYAPGDFELAEAIKTLDAQAQKGDIPVSGRDDILAKVIKKPARGCYVRGVGSGITNKDYFGPVDRPKVAQLQAEIESLKSQVAKLANTQQFMMAYFMTCGLQSTIQFSPEQMGQFMLSNFGQSSGGDGQSSCSAGQIGGSNEQMDGFSQFSQLLASSRKGGTNSLNVNVSKSRAPSEPQSHQHRVAEKVIPEPETRH